MSEIRIQIDPTNPGHFLACCGLMELCDVVARLERLNSVADGSFHFDANLPGGTEFVLHTPGSLDLNRCMEELGKCSVESVPHPDTSIAPLLLNGGQLKLALDWWLDETRTNKSGFKFWAANQTSHQTAKALLQALQGCPSPDKLPQSDGLYQWGLPMSTRFGLDPRPAWTSLGVGYSMEAVGQGKLVKTYPAVELLGAIGLQGFTFGQKKGGIYSYVLWETRLPTVAARAASVGALKETGGHTYTFPIVDRGSFKALGFSSLSR